MEIGFSGVKLHELVASVAVKGRWSRTRFEIIVVVE